MHFRTHILVGIIFFLALRETFPYVAESGQGNQLLFFLVVLLGSILPDIDETKSTITKWSGLPGKTVAVLFRHRGIWHSLFFAALAALLVTMSWNGYYAVALFAGYVSHLFADLFTRGGVQLFYPFSDFKIRGFLRVGGWMEKALYLLLIVLVVRIAMHTLL